ncbi:hypothetical protein C2I33_02900 [Ralstonia solanacearum]|nr:hypothetical protein C2I33_02900 [Ralstonia solanacearum]
MAARSMRFRADRTASRPVLGRATQAQRGRANAECGQQSINNERCKRDGDLHRHPRPACAHPASFLRMRRDTVDARPAGLMAKQHEANHSPQRSAHRSGVERIAATTPASPCTSALRISGACRLASAIAVEAASLTHIKTLLVGGRARRVRESYSAPGPRQPT